MEIRGKKKKKKTYESKIYRSCRQKFAEEIWNQYTHNILDTQLPDGTIADRHRQHPQLWDGPVGFWFGGGFLFLPRLPNTYASLQPPWKQKTLSKCRLCPLCHHCSLWRKYSHLITNITKWKIPAKRTQNNIRWGCKIKYSETTICTESEVVPDVQTVTQGAVACPAVPVCFLKGHTHFPAGATLS